MQSVLYLQCNAMQCVLSVQCNAKCSAFAMECNAMQSVLCLQCNAMQCNALCVQSNAICSVCSMQCKVFSVCNTMQYILCLQCNAICLVFAMQCKVFCVCNAMKSVLCVQCNAMQSVLCVQCNAMCSVFAMQCNAMQSVQCVQCNAKCSAFAMQCKGFCICNAICSVFAMQCNAMQSVQSLQCNAKCSVFAMQCNAICSVCSMQCNEFSVCKATQCDLCTRAALCTLPWVCNARRVRVQGLCFASATPARSKCTLTRTSLHTHTARYCTPMCKHRPVALSHASTATHTHQPPCNTTLLHTRVQKSLLHRPVCTPTPVANLPRYEPVCTACTPTCKHLHVHTLTRVQHPPHQPIVVQSHPCTLAVAHTHVQTHTHTHKHTCKHCSHPCAHAHLHPRGRTPACKTPHPCATPPAHTPNCTLTRVQTHPCKHPLARSHSHCACTRLCTAPTHPSTCECQSPFALPCANCSACSAHLCSHSHPRVHTLLCTQPFAHCAHSHLSTPRRAKPHSHVQTCPCTLTHTSATPPLCIPMCKPRANTCTPTCKPTFAHTHTPVCTHCFVCRALHTST